MKARLKDNWPVKVSSVELKQLQTLRSVVRQGRVAALHLDRVEFQNGTSLPRYTIHGTVPGADPNYFP